MKPIISRWHLVVMANHVSAASTKARPLSPDKANWLAWRSVSGIADFFVIIVILILLMHLQKRVLVLKGIIVLPTNETIAMSPSIADNITVRTLPENNTRPGEIGLKSMDAMTPSPDGEINVR
jgi:hypothetical protein